MLLFLLLLPILTLCAPENELVTNLPNLTEPLRSKHYTGYLNIADDKQIFYWYVESENDPTNDPIVLWLNGGPGCASMEGLFIEMGPFRVRDNGAAVDRNPWTWNRIANVIYMDAPAGVGLSYYNSSSMVFNDDQVASDNLKAVQLFFEKFPERKTNDFFAMGESYGGTYVPTLSSKIVQSGNLTNFKGMLIGNGCLDDKLNYNSQILYEYFHGLIDESIFRGFLVKCCGNSLDCDFHALSLNETSECGQEADDLSDGVFYTGIDPYFLYFACYLDGSGTNQEFVRPQQYTRANGKRRNLDYMRHYIRSSSKPICASHYDHVPYLNTKEVRQAIRIPEYVQEYSVCNIHIEENYQQNYTTMTPFFLEVIKANKKVALFNGDVDAVCNVAHNAQFLQKLGLKLKSAASPYKDPNQLPSTIGLVTEYEGVSLVTVRGGGHFPAATFQKPKETFQVFQNFVKSQNWSTPVTKDYTLISSAMLSVFNMPGLVICFVYHFLM